MAADVATTAADHRGSSAPDAVRPPPGNPRFPLLDAMRAIAALSILLTHASGVSNFNVDNALGAYTARLNFGVTIFFLLSGFLLYRPFVAARRQGRPAIRVRDFLRRRVLRIVPAYWVALTVLIAYPGLLGTINPPRNPVATTVAPIARQAPDSGTGPSPLHLGVLPRNAVLHADAVETGDHTARFYTFTQIYWFDSIVQGIGPAWTLCIEASFYLLLPFLALAIAKARPSVRGELAIIALLALATVALRTFLQARGGFSVWQNTLACYLDWFCYGMALAILSVAWHGREHGSRAVSLLVRRPWVPWLAAAVVFWFMATQMNLSRGFFVVYTDLNYFGEHTLYALCAVLLLLPAVFGDGAGGWPRRVLGLRVLRWAGLISYGVFLYHAPIMLELNRLGAQGWLPGSGLLSLALPTAAIAGACATASYLFVERPALRFKDRRGRRRSAPEAQRPAPAARPAG